MLFGRYASRRGEAKYPTLWTGLTAAWCPSVQGPSGMGLYDLSRNGRNATLSGFAPASAWVRDSQYSLESTSTSMFATVPLSAFPSGANARSGSCWVRTTATTRQGFFGCREAVGSTGWFFGLSNSTTLQYVVVGVGSMTATISAQTNTWAHFAFSFVGSAYKLYLNGRVVGSGASSGGTTSTAVTGLLFREQESAATETLQGRMDDVRLYNRALTDQEVFILSRSRGIAFTPRINRGRSSFIPRRSNPQLVTGGVLG